MAKCVLVLLMLFSTAVCYGQNKQVEPKQKKEVKENKNNGQIGGANKEQQQKTEDLIDQLVFKEGDATNKPVISPGIVDKTNEYRDRFTTCQKAFGKLYEMKGVAFPQLLKHLDDKRQSINFRNHSMANSVGDACYWNIYFQLVDRPKDYSSYGYSREGRDGKQHPKPYWAGGPFDDAGGLKKWLDKNSKLNYFELQIKCLDWLLRGEKKIGAADAASYFLNILPLEIRILERRLDNGEDVKQELNRLKKIRDEKLTDQIPSKLLPAKENQSQQRKNDS